MATILELYRKAVLINHQKNKTMKQGQKVTVNCPTYKRGRKFTGEITGEKPLAPLHIAQYGKTYFVKIDGNNKSTPFHESWIKANQ